MLGNEKSISKERNFSPDDVLSIFELFSGREDFYALQWVEKNNGNLRSGYSPVRSPLSFSIIERHLKGEYTVGIYQLNRRSEVKWAIYDVDIKKDIYANAKKEDLNEYLKVAEKIALELKAFLKALYLPSYLEFSGSKGYHVWLFFKNFLSARIVKRAMSLILEEFLKDLKTEIVKIEIFPKQSKIEDGGLGNLVKLPFGFHRLTGSKTYFIENGEILKSPIELQKKVEFISEETLKEVLKSFSEGNESEEKRIEDRKDEYDPFLDDEYLYLISHCRMLDYLTNKIMYERKMTNDEYLVLKYTLGNLKNGAEIVNYFLKVAEVKDDNMYLKSKLNGYPMGCKKIALKFPELSEKFGCACEFPDDAYTYKNPLLHLKKELLLKGRKSAEEKERAKFNYMFEHYIGFKKEVREKLTIIAQMEDEFNKYFTKKGIDELKTDFGKLKRVVHPDGSVSFFMEF